MPTPITREHLTLPYSVISQVAISKKTMYDVGENGEGIVKVCIPESIKATGKVPEGYAVGE